MRQLTQVFSAAIIGVFALSASALADKTQNEGTGFTNGRNDNAKGTEVVTGQQAPQTNPTSGGGYAASKVEARKAKKAKKKNEKKSHETRTESKTTTETETK
jgi:hypothetical protein